MLRKLDHQRLKEITKVLSKKEIRLLTKYFYDQTPQTKLAEAMHITQSQVCQALAVIKKKLEAAGIPAPYKLPATVDGVRNGVNHEMRLDGRQLDTLVRGVSGRYSMPKSSENKNGSWD